MENVSLSLKSNLIEVERERLNDVKEHDKPSGLSPGKVAASDREHIWDNFNVQPL